jgi:hypothetical protein
MVPPGVQFRVAAERSAGVLRRPERCQRQSLISCAATLGRSGPTTAGDGHPGTANAGDGALPGLAISAAGQPTFCAPRLSHTWVDTCKSQPSIQTTPPRPCGRPAADIESRGCAHERRIDRVVIDGPPVLPPSIDEVYEEGIPVCAPLEMPDRYRFHSLRRPRLKLSDANDPRAGGQSKRSSRNLFHSNAPGLSILTDANLAPAEREPSIPSILSKSCSDPVFTVRPK